MTHPKRRIAQHHPHQLTKQILSIDSALLIASATILGYLVAYRYQMGQFDYYQINEILFGQIYLNHIIIAMTAVFIFIIAILVIQIVLNWYYKQLPYFWSKVARHIFPWFLFLSSYCVFVRPIDLLLYSFCHCCLLFHRSFILWTHKEL